MSLEPELQVKPKFNQVTNLNPEQQSSDTPPHLVPTPSFSPSSRLPNPSTTFTQPQVPSPPHPTPSHQESPTPYLQLILIFPLPSNPKVFLPITAHPQALILMPSSPQQVPNLHPTPSPLNLLPRSHQNTILPLSVRCPQRATFLPPWERRIREMWM